MTRPYRDDEERQLQIVRYHLDTADYALVQSEFEVFSVAMYTAWEQFEKLEAMCDANDKETEYEDN